MNNFFKAALDKTWTSTWQAIISTEWSESDGELWLNPGTVAERNFTGQWQVIPYQPNGDISGVLGMLGELELLNTKLTGVSIDPNLVLQANTAFQSSIFEEKQMARLKPNNDERNIAIDRAMTLMLSNVSQFAPTLYADHVLDKWGKIKDYNWLEIRIDNKKVKRKGKKQEFKDAPGTYDFFDLDDELLGGEHGMMKVRIDTPTTATTLKALEKQEFNELIWVLMNVAQLNPQIAQKVWAMTEEMLDKMGMIYWFDPNKLSAGTREKANREEISKLKEGIAVLWSNVWNEPIQAEPSAQGGQAEAWQPAQPWQLPAQPPAMGQPIG